MAVSLLDKYIAKNVLSAIGLVTIMLAGLQIFMLFVNQIDDLGKAQYGIWQAFKFVMLQTPYQVYLFIPMASLLGALIGLGIMANNHELIVMRAEGMSITRIAIAVLKVAMLVILIATVAGETFIPRLSQWSNEQKLSALNEGQKVSHTQKGIWLRYKNDFITIKNILPDNHLKNVKQYHFDANHHLVLARNAKTVAWKNGQWIASDVNESHIGNNITTKHHDTLTWDVGITPKMINISTREPDEMTLYELHKYIKDQSVTSNYKISYWQRLLQPLTTAVMMILAIPFIFGPLRGSTMGSKLVVGATIGFGFHIINRIFGTISQVLQWSPVFAALAPTLLFAVLGMYLIKRVR